MSCYKEGKVCMYGPGLGIYGASARFCSDSVLYCKVANALCGFWGTLSFLFVAIAIAIAFLSFFFLPTDGVM